MRTVLHAGSIPATSTATLDFVELRSAGNPHEGAQKIGAVVLRSFSEAGPSWYTLTMHFVYILQSEGDQSHYVGSTDNIFLRVKEHNMGSNKYSSTKRPFHLVWYGAFTSITKALQFERYLKHGSGFAFRNKHLI